MVKLSSNQKMFIQIKEILCGILINHLWKLICIFSSSVIYFLLKIHSYFFSKEFTNHIFMPSKLSSTLLLTVGDWCPCSVLHHRLPALFLSIPTQAQFHSTFSAYHSRFVMPAMCFWVRTQKTFLPENLWFAAILQMELHFFPNSKQIPSS